LGLYATTTSLSELIPNYLSENTTTSDAAGAAIFSRHIDRAESMVNSYVSNKYSLPFVVVPPLIRTLTEDIACYYLIRSAYTQEGQNKNLYYPDYKTAMSILESIRDNKTSLALTDGSLLAADSTTQYLSSTENYTPITGLDDQINWDRDLNEINDQTSARRG